MAEFNRNLVHNVGTTYVSIASAPAVTDYYENYDVIIGLRIVNLLGTTITIRLRYYDDSETSNTFIEYDTPILTGEVLNINKKIVIESDDKLEIICSDVDGCDVICSYMRDGGYYVAPPPEWYGGTGIIGCGETGVGLNKYLDKYTISDATRVTNFAQLSVEKTKLAACSNVTKGFFVCGQKDGFVRTNEVESIVISTGGVASMFTNMTNISASSIVSASNESIGIVAGGWSGTSSLDEIESFDMGTGAIDILWPTLSSERTVGGCVSSGFKVYFAGGLYQDMIEELDFSSKVISTTSATLHMGNGSMQGASNPTHGIIAGGYDATYSYTDVIEKLEFSSVTINNSFSNLGTAQRPGGGCCDGIDRCIFGGGYGGSRLNAVESVEISSGTVNSAYAFLSTSKQDTCACSGN